MAGGLAVVFNVAVFGDLNVQGIEYERDGVGGVLRSICRQLPPTRRQICCAIFKMQLSPADLRTARRSRYSYAIVANYSAAF